ncbi:MAG TPA: glycosyltransferase family 39 protein, partial [Chthoniobacterales bacterium]|nr:glycosyltransferase family 39 protein [Chthoniobacterales bacterium]
MMTHRSAGESHPFNLFGGILTERWVVVLTLTLIICAAGAIRIRLLDMPLERDEGEYAYAGQLLLRGIPPYELAYNMKLPGTYAAYAVIMAVMGESVRAIHAGLLLVNCALILMVYLLGKRLFGLICGIVAAGSFAVLSLSHSVLGLAGHATHFVSLFAAAGALVLLVGFERNRNTALFCSGIFFGIAYVMKQHGVFFGLFGALVLLVHQWQQQPRDVSRMVVRALIFSVGMFLPFLVVCIYLA